MKYALRVIFWSRDCFLMIPEAPQPQIWTQSGNLKNHHFHHFLWSLCSNFSRRRNGLLCIPWGSPFACVHQNARSFRENLQRPRRLAKNMRTLKNWPSKSSKCHFSWKFATSPALPPYYSIEPMKYALRVIFWCPECFLMIPEAPQPQIWTQSWNPKNHHFHHFLWPLSSSLSCGRNHHSRFPWGSPFACAH